MNEFDDIDQKIEETVKEMKERIDKITASADDVDDDEIRAKAVEIKDKAVSILSNVIERLTALADEVIDSEEVKSTLDFVKEKARDLTDQTLKKIEDAKRAERVVRGINDVTDMVKKQGEKLVDTLTSDPEVMDKMSQMSDNATKVYEDVKKNVEEVLAKPEVSEAINTAKQVTVNVAEKAVKMLKLWLRPEVYAEKEEEKDEEV